MKDLGLSLLIFVAIATVASPFIYMAWDVERQLAKDRAWARRDNTDTRVVAAYARDIADTLRRDTEAAKTRQAVELLLAAWQPVEGSPLRWSLEWLARNTDRTIRPAPPTEASATSKGRA